MLEVTPKDITHLNALQLVDLLDLLLAAEVRQNGIAVSNLHVPLNITVADGGEYGIIECENLQLGKNSYIKTQSIIFQVKATEMTASKCATEITVKKQENKQKIVILKPRVEKALNQGCGYILFCNQEMVEQKIVELISTFKKTISNIKGSVWEKK